MRPGASVLIIRTEALVFCFDAFSLREPVSTSLENALRRETACERGALRQLDPIAVGIAHHRNPGGGAERHRRAGFAAPMGQHESVLAIDIEHLKSDVAPTLALEGCIIRRIGRMLDDQYRIARQQGRGSAGRCPLRQPKRLHIEPAMRLDVADSKANSDALDPE